MRLVFEAMGSTPNPVDFVLCEQQINSLKARVWLGDVGTEADLSGNITEDTIIVASERVTNDKRVSNSEGTIARLEIITNGEVNNIARLKASPVQQFSLWFQSSLHATGASRQAAVSLPTGVLRHIRNGRSARQRACPPVY